MSPSITQSKWLYIVTALDGTWPNGTGMIYGASNRQFSYNINAGRTAQCSMNIDNPRAAYILNNHCLMKVYRKNRLNNYDLLMVGDVISAEETGQGDIGVVTVTAADPFWRLQHRVLGWTVDVRNRGTGWSDNTIGPDGVTPIATKDLSTILLDIITYLNANGIYTGITTFGSTIEMSGTSQSIGPVFFQIAGDLMQQITTTTGAPDWELVPQEPSGAFPNTTIAQFNVHTHLGVASSPWPAVFQYGIGKHNVASYDRLVSRDGMANNVFSLPNGWPTAVAAGDGLVQSFDATSLNNEGQFDYVVDSSNLVSKPLRQELTAETLSILKQGRQQITFVPIVNCPLDFMTDYKVGDVVKAQAYEVSTNTVRFDGTARLYGVNFQVDENDAETPALTLIPGG